MKQLNFNIDRTPKAFGGSLNKGRRKNRRPLDSKQLLHVVLKADGDVKLRRHYKEIDSRIRKYAEKFGIKVHRLSIANTHSHLLIEFSNRTTYCRFIRSVTSQLSRKLKVKWTATPWSRVVHWGKDAKFTRSYIVQNKLEAAGAIDYQTR